jgi:hypothetical protein
MSMALGEPEESVSAALASPGNARELLAALKSPDRRTRAKALATALAPIVLELEQTEAVWAP